jgi:hypothetical protein
MVAEIADNLRFHQAISCKAKLRTFASFLYQAKCWLSSNAHCSRSPEKPACDRRSKSVQLPRDCGLAAIRGDIADVGGRI